MSQINLITVVGPNNRAVLPQMLEHYRGKVDKMYACIYGSSRKEALGIVDYLDGVEILKIVARPEYNWNRVTSLYNEAKRTKPDDWWIISDADELHSYGLEIEDIVRTSESSGCTFTTGGFLDRIGPDGTFPTVESSDNIFEKFPLAGFFGYPMSNACPNKVVIAKGSQDITSGQHFAVIGNTDSWRERGWNHPKRYPVEECFAQVHHFKWDSTCIKRIKDVAAIEKQYAFSGEYRKMYNAIKDSDFKIDIKNPEYRIESLENLSYINYSDYKQWDDLKNEIIQI